MGHASKIEWTDTTWNPVTGCDRTSPGCDHCYALRMAGRLKAMGNIRYQIDGNPRTSGPGFGVTCHPDVLQAPLSWRKPRLVFVNSMSDLFHHDVPLEFIQDVFKVMAATPQHTYQVLTKRSVRLKKVADQLDWPENVWVGVSIESDKYKFRSDHLSFVPAAVRFLSCEPLLGPIEGLNLDHIDWVIVGGESGPFARPMDPWWVDLLLEQCSESKTPFFFKQWGGRIPKANGREFGGRTWDEMPHRYTS